MSDPYARTTGRVLTAGVALTLALTSVLTGCSGDDKKAKAGSPGKPGPAPTSPPPSALVSVPGAKGLKTSAGLRKPIRYPDKITVSVASIKYVRNPDKGPGELTKKVLTIFTLRFANGSAKPLNLNTVRVALRYGPRQSEAAPTSYADLNDFFGTAAPGQAKTAAYAFSLPTAGYKSVNLRVTFDKKHRAAIFVGALKP